MIAVVAISVPLRQTFDYLVSDEMNSAALLPGIRVRVPFGKRAVVGVLLAVKESSKISEEKLKFITEILDSEPVVAKSIFDLCEWAADYYQHPVGEVFLSALPILLRQGKKAELKEKKSNIIKSQIQLSHQLNEFQQQAFDAISKGLNQFGCFLINGITGSGKTEIYLQLISELIINKKQALVLVPEISLTSQTISRFTNRFAENIVCFHSRMSNRERLNAWVKAKNGDAKIIIGTRSAIFTPCENLGIIIIDEEHDLSFKQQEGFRYSARDLACVRGQNENIPIVMGTATPSLESIFNVQKARFTELKLPERAGNAIHPEFKLIDIRDKKIEHGLVKEMHNAIAEEINSGNQVMLFLNRRGYSPTLMCHTCGWVATCKRCDVHLTLHTSPQRLHCHHCDFRQNVIKMGRKDLIGRGKQHLVPP